MQVLKARRSNGRPLTEEPSATTLKGAAETFTACGVLRSDAYNSVRARPVVFLPNLGCAGFC